MFPWLVFLAAFFLGMFLMFLIVCLTYSSRIIVFSNCPRETPYCMDNDYVNDPQEATDKGYQDTLFVVNDQLYFERPRRNRCVPHLDRPTHIRHPRYCLVEGEEYRHMGGDTYMKHDGSITYLGENCGSTGKPLPKW